jgi:putative ABC transport system permease protein
MKYLPIIWRNLLRRKIRTIFTLLTIFIAFVLFGVLMAIRAAFSMGVEIAGADRLMILNKISLIMPIPASYAERVRAVPGVKDVTHANWFGGYYQDPKTGSFANMAVDPESWLRMYPEFTIPEDQKKAWFADRTGAIVGVTTAKRFGWKVGDRIPLQATIFSRPDRRAWEFTIDGIYDSPVKGTDKTNMFFHYDYLDEVVRNTGFSGNVGWYVIRIHDPNQAVTVAKTIDGMFANSPAETKTDTEKNFVQGFAKQVGDIGAIMIAIVVAVMFTILLVSANTMAQSIRERTSELAVLKTLGFGDTRVLAMVIVESCVIAILGGGIGLGLSWALITMVGDPTGGFLPTFYFPPRDLIFGIALVLVLGLAAGALPAWQAGRLRIIDALRRN